MTTVYKLWRQRIGYGVADTACNLVWQMITLYLMFFYTDVMELNPISVGVMFLVTRIIDGVTDVLMGILIDNTNTKWGKSRPYFLWGAIPFAVFAVATFYVPDFGPQGRLIWAYATYTGLSLMYTMVNIPLASILPSLTDNAYERTVLATTRMVFSFLGATLISTVAMPMIDALGDGNKASGYFTTMAIWAVVAALLFLFSFKNVEERVEVVQVKRVSLVTAYHSLKENGPWKVFALNIVFMWGAFFFQGGALIYYVTYNLHQPELVSVIAGITAFVPMIGTLAAPLLSKRMLKIRVYQIASVVMLFGMSIMLLIPSTFALICGAVVVGLGFGLRNSIYFSMQADPIDYGEWKSGVNVAGILSAVNGFIGKISFAIAGAASGYLLSSNGYIPDADQAESALTAIKACYFYIPMLLIVSSIVLMTFFYKLDYIFPRITAELDERKSKETLVVSDELDGRKRAQAVS
jgi:sugar (glycoside-pentoside-hexuronide) transporter